MKHWKTGHADEVWKVIVCAHDAAQAERTLQSLCYILTDCGHDYQRGEQALQRMTGEEIIKGLRNYHQCAVDTIKNGLVKMGEKQ